MINHSVSIQTKTGFKYPLVLLIKLLKILYYDRKLKQRNLYKLTFIEWIILHNLKKSYHENN